MSKGDRYRPVDREKFNDNYDRIFKKKEPAELAHVKVKKTDWRKVLTSP